MNLGIPFYIRKAIQREVPAHRCAPSLEERMTVKNGQDHPHKRDDSEMQFIHDPQRQRQESGYPRYPGADHEFQDRPNAPVPRSFSTLDLENQTVDAHLKIPLFSLQHTTPLVPARTGSGLKPWMCSVV